MFRNAAGNGMLRMPPGSTVTSPAMCIDLNYPTIRYFVRDAAADQVRLRTQVMYVDHETAYSPYTVGKLMPRENWRLTEDIEIEPERGGVEAGWRRIAFRFVADQVRGRRPDRRPLCRSAHAVGHSPLRSFRPGRALRARAAVFVARALSPRRDFTRIA